MMVKNIQAGCQTVYLIAFILIPTLKQIGT